MQISNAAVSVLTSKDSLYEDNKPSLVGEYAFLLTKSSFASRLAFGYIHYKLHVDI